MTTIVVHDTRVVGEPPGYLADYCFQVNDHYPIMELIDDTKITMIETTPCLRIVCHGFSDTQADTASIPETLGFGLELCSERLDINNVEIMHGLRNCVENIIIFACGSDNAAPCTGGTMGHGQRFCIAMAAHTNANIFVSDVTQYYNPGGRAAPDNMICADRSHVFHQWEGNVYRFSPNGRVAVIVSNPTED